MYYCNGNNGFTNSAQMENLYFQIDIKRVEGNVTFYIRHVNTYSRRKYLYVRTCVALSVNQK